MKIIHIITGLATGGAERALFNLLHGGLAESHENHIISLGDEGTVGPRIRELGVPVTTLDMRRGRPSLNGLARLLRVVRVYQPEVIQGWMYHGNLAACIAGVLAHRRAAVGWNVRHSLHDLAYEKFALRQIIRANRLLSVSVDSLLYNSHLSRSQHESFGFCRTHGHVIPNGIDTEQFRQSHGLRTRHRSRMNIPADATVVGHIARFHAMKDHPAFVRAAVRLALQYPETHYLLIGLGVSIENETLIRLIPEHVRGRFHLLGERSDISELMNAIDIFCVSSAFGEGFPNVIGEAMATHLPCVVTDVGDSGIIVGETGVVTPPQNDEALAAGIESLLSIGPDGRRKLGLEARKRIEENYRLGAIVERYAALYEELRRTKRSK